MVQHTCIWQGQYDSRQSKWLMQLLDDEVNTARTEGLIQTDRVVTLRHMTSDRGLLYSTTQHIFVDVLQYYNVCARCVPHALTDKKKVARMITLFSFLPCYAADRQKMAASNCSSDERGASVRTSFHV